MTDCQCTDHRARWSFVPQRDAAYEAAFPFYFAPMTIAQ
jgi:hypothetical protein